MRSLIKATHQGTREHNVRLVMRALAGLGPISRADIARRTDLTRTTVSDVVSQLAEAGLVQEIGRGPSSGGKAPILLQIPRDARQLIGVHVGEGQVRGAIVNLAGDISHRERLTLDGRDGDEALARLDELVDRLVAAAVKPPLGIGIGTSGLVDTSSGTVRWAVHLDWRDLHLGARLRNRTGLPVYVANDSQAAALAEWTFGRHAPARGMVVVKVGNGIGAGIIIEDRLYQGDGFGAGEIGHISVAANDLRCRCGRTGCLETVASLRAVDARIAAVTGDVAVMSPAPLDEPDALERSLAAFHAGDPRVVEIVLEAGRYLGRMLGHLVGTLDIHDIVLIGSMTAFGEPWLDAVRREAHRSALPLLVDETRIGFGNLGSDIVELGAAALLMTSELGLSQAA
jgi:N-acetylglucosamine repressor